MTDGDRFRDTLLANLASVRARVAEACRRAGRSPDEVTIVGVTKYVSAATARIAHACGLVDLGESRPQTLWEKVAALADLDPSPRWHLIGHLQRNKVRRTLPALHLLHSLDSMRLLETVAAEAAAAERCCDALVEVNVSGAAGRTGVAMDDVAALVTAGARTTHLRIRGLMAMAGLPDGDPAAARGEFARVRELRDRLAMTVPGGDRLRELSMGMSGDFEAAILEGATILRLGSVLLPPPGSGDGAA